MSSHAPEPQLPHDKPPYHPFALFSLALLAFLSPPLGVIALALSSFNWARLGFPERRWLWLSVSLLSFLLPVAFGLSNAPNASKLAPLLLTFGRLGVAYAFLVTQRPLYEAFLTDNPTRRAPMWPLYALGALMVLSFLVGLLARGGK